MTTIKGYEDSRTQIQKLVLICLSLRWIFLHVLKLFVCLLEGVSTGAWNSFQPRGSKVHLSSPEPIYEDGRRASFPKVKHNHLLLHHFRQDLSGTTNWKLIFLQWWFLPCLIVLVPRMLVKVLKSLSPIRLTAEPCSCLGRWFYIIRTDKRQQRSHLKLLWLR